MATAYWCLLLAAVLPYVWIAVAKSAAPAYNNKDPRGWLARQDSARVRNANAAHLNAFEAFPAFAAGVLMAQFAGVDPQRIALLAVGFSVLRVLHGLFYLTGVHLLRTLAWLGGFVCVLGLMVLATLQVAELA